MAIIAYNTPDGAVAIEVDDASALPVGFQSKGGSAAAGGAHVFDGGDFDAAIGRLKAIGNSIARTLGEIAIPPESAEVELALKFTAVGGAIFAKLGGEAQMSVKLTWKRAGGDGAKPPV